MNTARLQKYSFDVLEHIAPFSLSNVIVVLKHSMSELEYIIIIAYYNVTFVFAVRYPFQHSSLTVSVCASADRERQRSILLSPCNNYAISDCIYIIQFTAHHFYTDNINPINWDYTNFISA